SIVGAATLILLAYAGWLRASGIGDLRTVIDADVAEGAPAMIVTGNPAGGGDYIASFFVDPVSGESWRIGSTYQARLAADGKSAVWLEGSMLEPDRTVAMRAVRKNGELRIERTRITFEKAQNLLLSGDGSRLAVMQGQILGVWDAESGRTVATAKLPEIDQNSVVMRVKFVDASTLRFHLRRDVDERYTIEILEFDVEGRSWTRTGSVETSAVYRPLRHSPDGTRMLVAGPEPWTVRDAINGDLVATLATGGESAAGWATFTGNDRIVVLDRSTGRLVLFTADGIRLRDYPALGRATLPVSPRPGTIAFAGAPRDTSTREEYVLYLLDLESGAMRAVAPGVWPAFWWRGSEIEPGSFASKIFWTDTAVFWFDPFSGERRTIAGSGPPG
ncbi:MAG: hypothetical protein LC732_03985, partial [Acidobacteria bacterium]|nr:hypothetical protein [Acidobacteriota bacterium]